MNEKTSGFTKDELAHYTGLAYQTHPGIREDAHAELQNRFVQARSIAGNRRKSANDLKRVVSKLDRFGAVTGVLVGFQGAGPIVGGLMVAGAAAVEGINQYSYNQRTKLPNARKETLQALMEEEGVPIPEIIRPPSPHALAAAELAAQAESAQHVHMPTIST